MTLFSLSKAIIYSKQLMMIMLKTGKKLWARLKEWFTEVPTKEITKIEDCTIKSFFCRSLVVGDRLIVINVCERWDTWKFAVYQIKPEIYGSKIKTVYRNLLLLCDHINHNIIKNIINPNIIKRLLIIVTFTSHGFSPALSWSFVATSFMVSR